MLTQISNRLPVLAKSALDRKLDATEFLTREHMKVESLFIQIKLLGQVARRVASRRDDLLARRRKMFAEMRRSLEKHMLAEESAFYPEIRKIEGLEGKVEHSYEEHGEVKTILSTMEALPIDGEEFDVQLSRLIKNVMHHVREEEEEIFPRVRAALSHGRLEKLATALKGAKKVKKKHVEKKSTDESAPGSSEAA